MNINNKAQYFVLVKSHNLTKENISVIISQLEYKIAIHTKLHAIPIMHTLHIEIKGNPKRLQTMA